MEWLSSTLTIAIRSPLALLYYGFKTLAERENGDGVENDTSNPAEDSATQAEDEAVLAGHDDSIDIV